MKTGARLASAVLLYRAALGTGFLLAAMFLASGVSFGFIGFDGSNPWSLWALIVMANPFVALATRHIYAERFDDPKNLLLLSLAVAAVIATNLVLTLS